MASNFQQKKRIFLFSLPGARFQNAWLKLAFALLVEGLISPVAIVESEKTAIQNKWRQNENHDKPILSKSSTEKSQTTANQSKTFLILER